MPKDLNNLSRIVSHALRHEPWVYELELDEQGWVATSSLLAAIRSESESWQGLSETDLAEMIRTSSKQRHEIVDGRIRALYGHSLPQKLHRTAAAPPVILFHGTAPATVPLIRASGLLPMGRQYVHLSLDRETALAVGSRKAAEPTILTIRAAEASATGFPFYLGNDKVWLADRVPPEFID